jgi:hypothetical protein
MNGSTTVDSYNGATETYPGTGGANGSGSLASNGNITLVGNVVVQGDVRPGVNGSIQPQPLEQDVQVSGWMGPLDVPIIPPAAAAFTPPATNNNTAINPQADLVADNKTGAISLNVKTARAFPTTLPASTQPTAPPNVYVLAGWSQSSQTATVVQGPATVYINGDLTLKGQSTLKIDSATGKVIFYVNGNFDAKGGTITNTGLPTSLDINMTKAGTTLSLGGGGNLYAHILAPLSDVNISGNPGFYGSVISKTLTVTGNSAIHYDESVPEAGPVVYTASLVK